MSGQICDGRCVPSVSALSYPWSIRLLKTGCVVQTSHLAICPNTTQTKLLSVLLVYPAKKCFWKMLCYFSATSQAEFLIYQSFCVSLYNMLQLNLIFFM